MMQVKIQMPGGAQFSSTARSIRFSGEQEEASTQAIGHLSKMLNQVTISDHTDSKQASVIGQSGSPKTESGHPFKTPKPFSCAGNIQNNSSRFSSTAWTTHGKCANEAASTMMSARSVFKQPRAGGMSYQVESCQSSKIETTCYAFQNEESHTVPTSMFKSQSNMMGQQNMNKNVALHSKPVSVINNPFARSKPIQLPSPIN